MELKKTALPDGSRRPCSMGMSGNDPKALDGLCKLISLDTRLMDPAGIGFKLRKLIAHAGLLGEFMAKTPGNEQRETQTWPSTIPYAAALVLRRYHELGMLGPTVARLPNGPHGCFERVEGFHDS